MQPCVPAAIMARAAAWAQNTEPLRLTAIIRSQSASAMSRKRTRGKIPALFARTSIRPNSATARSTSMPGTPAAATSPCSSATRRPCARTASAAAPAATASSSQLIATS
nr:hypothetical protein [Caldovatus aquaticus]